MGQTLVEKIIGKNVGHPVKAGETVIVNVDFAALHDGSGPLMVRLLKERAYDKDPVFDPNRMLFANEFGPESTREVANEHALAMRSSMAATGKRAARVMYTRTSMKAS